MEPKTMGKRIVSKGAYVSALGAKVVLVLFALGFVGFGGVFLAVTYGIIALLPHIDVAACFGILIILAIGGGGAFLLFCSARQVITDAKNMDAGVPLTRANTAYLPAPDSLVRASAEPLQAQEAVLLRAATEGVEPSPESLLRASSRLDTP